MAMTNEIYALAPDRDVKTVTILGATGTVGRNTLDLLQRNPGQFRVEALTAHSNVDLLATQAIQMRARLAVIGDESLYQTLQARLQGTGISAAAGPAAIVEAAQRPVDRLVAGIVGLAGLPSTLAAVRTGTTIALANKECLVAAGQVFMQALSLTEAELIPIDSEHNAIFQVLDQDRPTSIDSIILTASGGPFRTYSRAQMQDVTPQQALAHPNWQMGPKISIDSATMMNKGLELIEAFYLFPVAEDQLETVIHPQSVVHSLVRYVDGSILAQLGAPDMRTPISYALAWPERMPTPMAKLDLVDIGQLTFEAPDLTRFPCLKLAGEALSHGAAAPTVLNAANEVAVAAFLQGRIAFLQIADLVAAVLERCQPALPKDLESVVAIDDEARCMAEQMLRTGLTG